MHAIKVLHLPPEVEEVDGYGLGIGTPYWPFTAMYYHYVRMNRASETFYDMGIQFLQFSYNLICSIIYEAR